MAGKGKIVRDQLTPEMAEQLRAWIKARKKDLGISLYAFAELTGISYTVLNKFLNKQRPSIDLVAFIKLRKAGHMSLDTMVDVHPDQRRHGGGGAPNPPEAPSPGQGGGRKSGGQK